MVFVAKAINGAYYLHNKTVKERQSLCNAVKVGPYRPLVMPKRNRLESTLQEWHVRLAHVNKETLVSMLSKGLVSGMPTLPAAELRRIPFFCTTCAEMKKRRMSYRNTKGSRDTQPISTIHMDTNGQWACTEVLERFSTS